MSESLSQPQTPNVVAIARRLRRLQLAAADAPEAGRREDLALALREVVAGIPPAERAGFLDALAGQFPLDVAGDETHADVEPPSPPEASPKPTDPIRTVDSDVPHVAPPPVSPTTVGPLSPEQLTEALCSAANDLPDEVRRSLADRLLAAGFLPTSPDLPTLPLDAAASSPAESAAPSAEPADIAPTPAAVTPAPVAMPAPPVAAESAPAVAPPIDPDESAALAAIAQRLGLPVAQVTDRVRLLQLLEHLLDLTLAPDHLVWELWSRVAPRSGVRRSRPGTLRDDARRFVAGDATAGRPQLAVDVAELRGLILSAVNALADAPRSLAGKLREKLAPTQIEQAVRIEGNRVWVPSTADTACWRRFVELFARIESGGGLEQQCQDLIVRTVESYHGAGGRHAAATRPPVPTPPSFAPLSTEARS